MTFKGINVILMTSENEQKWPAPVTNGSVASLFKGEDMEYYVYFAKIGEEVVYIGKGKGDRSDHVNSGTSHNYYLNQAHFQGVLMDVQIYMHFDCEVDALTCEAAMIKELKPKWNYMPHPAKKVGVQPGRGGAGVQFTKNRWRAYIHRGGKKIHIGYFDTKEEAQNARSSYL
jgi:hypothetical protein